MQQCDNNIVVLSSYSYLGSNAKFIASCDLLVLCKTTCYVQTLCWHINMTCITPRNCCYHVLSDEYNNMWKQWAVKKSCW